MERNTYLAIGSKLKTGVYKIINTLNNKVYVGSTSQGFYERKHIHLYELRKNIHSNSLLQRAWNKYGEDNFKFEILEWAEKNNCIEREQYWIDFYDCCNKAKGYNLKPIAGSSLGYKYTKEQRNNISKGLTTKKAVIQLDFKGNKLNEFASIKLAGRTLNIDPKLISGCCNNHSNNAKGYNFIFKKDYDSNKNYSLNVKDIKKVTCSKILQKDLDGNIIKEWDSLTDIVTNNPQFKKVTLSHAIRKTTRLRTAYTFKWEYKF